MTFFKITKAISYFLAPFISSPSPLIRRPKPFAFTSFFYSSLNKPFPFPSLPFPLLLSKTLPSF